MVEPEHDQITVFLKERRMNAKLFMSAKKGVDINGSQDKQD